MPLIDSDDAANWVGATSLYTVYNIDQDPQSPTFGQILGLKGYERIVRARIAAPGDIDRLIAVLVAKGMTKGQRIAIVGAGFGWVAEYLIDQGYGPATDGTLAGRVGCTDTSAWIQ